MIGATQVTKESNPSSDKRQPGELAILGGPKAFAKPLHVGRPNVGDRAALLGRINTMLDNLWFTNDGHLVQEFERRLAAYLGVDHVIAMCNGTIALEILFRALGLKGEVIVPSFTFVATAHALQWQEITPVFCDIDPKLHTLDPNRVEALITPRTTGIIGVHTWGNPCQIEHLTEISRRRKLRLAFDAAHAFGCSHRNRMVGSFGEAEVFSFHATKFFNSFEGGAVATNDPELAERIRLMKNFGFTKSGYDNVVYIGINGKMTEVCAAMGLTSLESVDIFIARNRANYKLYRKELAGVPGLRLMEYTEDERRNFQYVVMEIDSAIHGLTRDDLVRILHAENVLARKYFYPACHRMEPYRSFFPHAGLLLPETDRLVEKVISLPNGLAVDEQEIQTMCGIIRFCLENGRAIKRHLPGR